MGSRQGKIIVPAGVFPEKHELETASYFAAQGKDVEFQLPSRVKGVRTPDVQIEGVLFEMKCPFGKGRRTIQTCLQRASKQSANIIMDLRHTPLKTEHCLSVLKREFKLRSNIKSLLIITKAETNNLIELNR
ncbi:MAG: hypothetical protein LBK67_00780 [Coriobacteriales bacterium]|jgi:ribosomal protein S11|nr:hypothetical protein [Coriobacteriales bacterium]